MRTFLLRSSTTAATCVLLCASAVTWGFDDRPGSPVEIDEWSVWVGNPAQSSVNASRAYRNAMPAIVGTSRPKFEDKELAGKFAVAPISVAQFFGESTKDVDVDLQAKKGTILAHWPPGAERGSRIQWFGSDLSSSPAANIPQAYFPESHWFGKLRDNAQALYLRRESHLDRFVAYDTELSIPIPLKIRGGPDEFSLQNLTSRRLIDVAIIAPTDRGFRVGWLDELPTAAPPEKKEAPRSKKTAQQKAEAVFTEPAKKTDENEPDPLPAEADPNVRARIDQILNRPVVVNVEKVAPRDVLDLIASQARLRYELDDRTLAKAQIKLEEPTTMKVSGVAARDALADLLGNLGLSYRVTEDGKLWITTAARLADEAVKKGNVVEGPPVKVVMSQPLKETNPSYRELTRDSLARRLAGQGLREDVVQLFLSQYAKVLFEPAELVVLAHFTRAAIDETVLLDVFPPPKKMVRTALLVIHGVDPRLQDRARALVRQLGDQSYKTRESAEARLAEMGPIALPALEDALISKDVEIVFRAERLLLRLNRPVP
jgi:hypothetical protein